MATNTSAFYYDGAGDQLYVYNWTAAAWQQAGGGSGAFNPFFDPEVMGLTVPGISNFSINQGSHTGGTATATDLHSRGIVLTSTGHTNNADNPITVGEPVPNASAFTAIALLHPFNIAYSTTAGMFVEGTGGNFEIFTLTTNGGSTDTPPVFFAGRYSDIQTYDATDLFMSTEYVQGPIWMKVKLVSGNFEWFASQDGENWSELGSIGASYVGTPANVGLRLSMNTAEVANNNSQAQMNCYSWTNTTP